MTRRPICSLPRALCGRGGRRRRRRLAAAGKWLDTMLEAVKLVRFALDKFLCDAQRRAEKPSSRRLVRGGLPMPIGPKDAAADNPARR